MKKFETINLEQYVNNIGITSIENASKGELAFSGASIPLDEIKINIEFLFENIPFIITKNAYGDNVKLEGQKIQVNKNIKDIHFLGVSSRGNFKEHIYICNNNETLVSEISFTDFRTNNAFFNDKPAIIIPYIHLKGEKFNYSNSIIWYNNLTLDKSMFCEYIKFPDNFNMHIFAITVS